MLVDVKFPTNQDPVLALLCSIADGNGNDPSRIRHAKGVYEIGHFNFDHEMGLRDYEANYPALENIHCYGVCDGWRQVVHQCPNLADDNPGLYVLSVTPVVRAEQPDSGGWRWHKWGPYIGSHEITREYLYDEAKIERVYCYHVYCVPKHLVE